MQILGVRFLNFVLPSNNLIPISVVKDNLAYNFGLLEILSVPITKQRYT